MNAQYEILSRLSARRLSRSELFKSIPLEVCAPVSVQETLRQLLEWGFVREDLPSRKYAITCAGDKHLAALRQAVEDRQQHREDRAHVEEQNAKSAAAQNANAYKQRRNELLKAVIGAVGSALAAGGAYLFEHAEQFFRFLASLFR